MSEIISVDDTLYKEIKKIKDKIKEQGCANPSWSNAIRSSMDLPHISGRGAHDMCGETKSVRRNMKIPEGQNGKELRDPEALDFVQSVGYEPPRKKEEKVK